MKSNEHTTRKEYLKNSEFVAEVVKCKGEGKCSNRLAAMFILLARKVGSRPNFNGYSYLDEMIAHAIEACVANYHKFDETKGEYPNAHAYFTRVVWTAFLQVLNAERVQRDIRDDLLLEANMNPSFGYMERNQDVSTADYGDTD